MISNFLFFIFRYLHAVICDRSFLLLATMASAPSKHLGSISEYSDSSDDEYLQDIEEATAFLALLSLMTSAKRHFKWAGIRLNWVDHVAKLTHTEEFKQTYHMSHAAFKIFLEILCPAITVDVVKSRNSTPNSDPIYPELVMHISL